MKRRVFSPTALSAFSYFTVAMCSQASAKQRSGRAGREGPGVCYRLYSSAVFSHQMQSDETPQVQRMPLDQLLLFMAALGGALRTLRAMEEKSFSWEAEVRSDGWVWLDCASMGFVGIPRPSRFPFPSAPSSGALSAARRRLIDLGALHAEESSPSSSEETSVRCTSLGLRLSDLPLPPRFGKMLLVACAR